MNTTDQFFAKVKHNAERKAAYLAWLELSEWDNQKEIELKEHHKFNDKMLSERKAELELKAKAWNPSDPSPFK